MATPRIIYYILQCSQDRRERERLWRLDVRETVEMDEERESWDTIGMDEEGVRESR